MPTGRAGLTDPHPLLVHETSIHEIGGDPKPQLARKKWPPAARIVRGGPLSRSSPPVIDEDPSPQDIERFGGDTAYCPACGAEVFDQAEACPACGSWIGGATESRPPLDAARRRRWLVLAGLAALAALLAAVILAVL